MRDPCCWDMAYARYYGILLVEIGVGVTVMFSMIIYIILASNGRFSEFVVMEEIVCKFNYIVVVILMMTGLWSMLAQSNLIKKCIGMAIFQTGIILFFISIGAKNNASIPIVAKEPLSQAIGQGTGRDAAPAGRVGNRRPRPIPTCPTSTN